MSLAYAANEEPFRLDTSHLITEDDEPLDSTMQERQQKILPDSLYASWVRDTPFVAFSNVGLFHSIRRQAVVPDVMVSVDVEALPLDQSKSYFVWEYGKPPDLVVEIVSKTANAEDTDKMALYAQIGVAYYVIYDPYGYLSKIPLRVFTRAGRGFVEQTYHKLDGLGLGLTIWEGTYAGCHGKFLRFLDDQGRLLLTGEESSKAAKAEAQEAKAEAQEAKAEAQEAKAEAQEAKVRAALLEKKLRDLGIEP